MQVWKALMQKRYGGVAFGASLGERVLAINSFQRSGVQLQFRIGPTKVQKWTGAAWASIANTALTGNDNNLVDWVIPELSGEKLLVFTNLSDNIRKWTGTGNDADLGGSPPRCKYLINYQGYLLALHTIETGTSFPQRVRWPDAGNIEGWSTGDAGAKDLLDDDQEITGGEVYGRYAAVHKDTGIYLGYLTNTSTIIRFERREVQGAAANNSIINLPTGEQIYVSRTGLRLFNGVNGPLIQSQINEQLRETMNPEFIQRSWGLLVEDLDEVWFGIPIGASEDPDTIFKYNYVTKEIYPDERPGCTMAGLYQVTAAPDWDSDPDSWDSDLTPWNHISSLALSKRVLVGFNDGVTHERTTSVNDDGDAIDAEWESKDYTAADFDMDDPQGIGLEWQGVDVEAIGTSVDVYYSLDDGVNFTFAKTLTLSSTFPTMKNAKIAWFRAFGEKCRFKLKNNTVGGTFAVKQIRPIIIPREGRQ